jgi:hypothetical protein
VRPLPIAPRWSRSRKPQERSTSASLREPAGTFALNGFSSFRTTCSYAGTPAVVTTLWKVDDQASFVPHPFFWAAFGLTGAP